MNLRYVFSKFATLILFIVFTLQAQQTQLPTEVEKATDLLLKQDYEGVRRIITRTPITEDDSLFLEILYSQAKMVDYESYKIHGRDFLMLCDSARKSFKKIEEYKRPLLLQYYLGTLEGAAALTRAKRGDIMGALTASNVSRHFLEIVVAKDSAFTPAYYGVGMREYYSSSLFNKLGLAKKTVSKSIKKMEITLNDSSATALAIAPSLMWIYLDRELFTQAEELSQRFLKEYPENSLMLRAVEKMYLLQKKYDAAMSLAHRIQKSSEEREPINWSDYYAGGVALVSSWIGTERYLEAADEATRLLALQHDKKTLRLEWVKKHRNHLVKLKEEAVSKL